MNGVVDLEVTYQNGKISYDELYNKVNGLYDNIFNKENILGFYSDEYFIELVPIE
ncbi:MAG: hypothetical protein NC341_09200 [Blautia sp.]|nr:hypothetical protein [Blautia sp.]